MAGIKISELPEASSICGNELVPIVQGSCTKFVSASAIGSTGADNITSITAGCGLVGGGCSGSINIAIDSNCFAQFNGTTTTMEAFSGNWESAYSTVEGLSSNWDQSACAGLNCVGDITGLCVGSGLVGGGESGTVNVCIDAVCSVAWNGTTSIVAANSATWGSGGGGGITGFDAGGDGITIDDSDTTSVVVEVDSTVARTNSVDERFNGNLTIGGNLSSVGNILSGGVNIDQLFGSGGGGTTITGTATKIAKFNSAGNNVEDSASLIQVHLFVLNLILRLSVMLLQVEKMIHIRSTLPLLTLLLLVVLTVLLLVVVSIALLLVVNLTRLVQVVVLLLVGC